MTMNQHQQLCICANAFPATCLKDYENLLADTLPKLKRALNIPAGELCPIGLWLAAQAAGELLQNNRQNAFRNQLIQAGFTAYTANAFPFGKFHRAEVKTRVYTPDWTTPERLHYTLNVARIMAEILPENGRGSISTLPAGYHGMTEDMLAETARNLRRCAGELARLKEQTGKHLSLAVEMEPDCQWENPTQFADFYHRFLQNDPNATQHLGVCYDTCHQELLGGTPGEGLARLLKQGIPVPKIQFSAALAVTSPEGWNTLLQDYRDPVYLHQTRILNQDRMVVQAFADMPDHMPEMAQPPHRTVVHFHVPVNQTHLAPGLETAREELLATLDLLRNNPDFKPDLEIETYTYTVLPGFQHNMDAILQAMGQEVAFIAGQLRQ